MAVKPSQRNKKSRSKDKSVTSAGRPVHTPWLELASEGTRTKRPKMELSLVSAPGRGLDEPLKDYATVLSHAVDTFGSRTNANAWLNKPNRVFHNQTPLQILTEDPAAVEEELVRIDHGMYI